MLVSSCFKFGWDLLLEDRVKFVLSCLGRSGEKVKGMVFSNWTQTNESEKVRRSTSWEQTFLRAILAASQTGPYCW